MNTIDLTGGEVKVIGNRGDIHTFRLSNPVEQEVIITGGTYEADFTSSRTTEPIEVEMSEAELATGSLLIPIEIRAGVYRVRSVEPTRTLLIIEVEVR